MLNAQQTNVLEDPTCNSETNQQSQTLHKTGDSIEKFTLLNSTSTYEAYMQCHSTLQHQTRSKSEYKGINKSNHKTQLTQLK